MRLKIYSILLLSLIGFVGCVDSNYDLSKVSTDDITIGDNNSEFYLPVATIVLSTSDIDGSSTVKSVTRNEVVSSSSDLSMQEMLDLANAFLPTGESVNIEKLTSTEGTESDDYVDYLTETLVGELATDSSKCDELAAIIAADEDGTYDDIFSTIDVDKDADVSEIAAAIQKTAKDDDGSLQTAIADAIKDEDNGVVTAVNDYANTDVEFTIDAIEDLPTEIFDMLGDGDIYIIATYEDDLPFTFTIGNAKLDGGDSGYIEFPITAAGTDIDPALVDIEEFVDILESGSDVTTDIKLVTYSAVATTGEETLRIKLSLKKTGAISASL